MPAAASKPRPHVATALDRFDTPPCARLLGCVVAEARPDDGWIRLAFEAGPDFLNPAGFVQGGILAAMLDDSMGAAILTHTDGRLYSVTINMNVSFLSPAKAGRLFGEGQVVQLGKTTGFVEARLVDAAGRTLARSTASVRLVEADVAFG